MIGSARKIPYPIEDRNVRGNFEDVYRRLEGAMAVPGMIIMWAGSVGDIPTGWALCDGANGTPDLSDRFVLGAGTYDVGDTGGATTHGHSAHAAGNTGTPGATTEVQSGSGATVASASHTHPTPSLSHDAANHMPPYYVLAFIMKL